MQLESNKVTHFLYCDFVCKRLISVVFGKSKALQIARSQLYGPLIPYQYIFRRDNSRKKLNLRFIISSDKESAPTIAVVL